MSEEDSREEETKKEEEAEKSEEEVKENGEEEEEEEAKEEEKKPKKRGRPAGKTTAAKKAKTEKGAEGGTKKKRKPAKKHPKTMDMVVEAIEILGDSHGSSVQAIKSYIIQNFKTVRTDMIKSMLRRALTMGLQQNIVARPKAQVNTQVMSGRYLLGTAARKEDEDEILPYKNRSPLPVKTSKKKKKGKKGRKSPKKPVARKVSPAKVGRPVKTGRRGRK